MDKKRIAILASHPIEQQGPFFKVLAAQPEIDLEVLFCWKFGVDKPTFDPDFGHAVQWDVPLLDGYKYRFLWNWALRPTSARFFGRINPGVISAVWFGGYDAVIVYGWNSFTDWFAFAAAIVARKPFFIRGDNALRHELLKSARLRRFKKALLGWLFRRAAGIFYVGEENCRFYEYYGVPPSKLHFTPHAVDNARFMAQAAALKPQRDALRQKYGIDAGAFVILFLGKLIQKKRPFDVLHAYEQLMSSRVESSATVPAAESSPVLIFVGDGPLRPELERYVAEKKLHGVHFAGFKNQKEIGEFYALADVFVLPSQTGETWGFVLNEAMCFGLPLIVSDLVGAGPDLVRPGETGYIVPVGDVADLTHSINELLRDPERREAYGRAAAALVAQYSYEKIAAAMTTAIKGAAEAVSRPTK